VRWDHDLGVGERLAWSLHVSWFAVVGKGEFWAFPCTYRLWSFKGGDYCRCSALRSRPRSWRKSWRSSLGRRGRTTHKGCTQAIISKILQAWTG
jgi:hypothetical protein